MLMSCLSRKIMLSEIKILSRFRAMRERLASESGQQIEVGQYEHVAVAMQISASRVREVVTFWMHERPLRHLRRCRLPAIEEFFEALRQRSVKIGIFSDYPVEKKLLALELRADATRCATDPDVDRLKPHPKGLQVLCAALGVPPEGCLMIGDRDDRDGAAAGRAGMPYLIRSTGTPTSNTFNDYQSLTKEVLRNGAW